MARIPAPVLLLAIACAWLHAACTPFHRPPSPPPTAAYLLDGKTESGSRIPTPAANGPVVTVPRTRSAPGFDTDLMAYVTEPYRLDHFAYHRWARKPADMFHQALTRSLADSGSFSAVLDGSSPARADLLLETDSFSLIQFFEKGGSRMEMEINARIVDLTDRSVRAERTFHVSEPTQLPDPVSGVEAANRALSRILEEMTDWIGGVITAGENTGP